MKFKFLTKLLLILLFLSICKIEAQSFKLQSAKNEVENLVFHADSSQIENIAKEKFKNISEIKEFKKIISRDVDLGLKELIYQLTFSYIKDKSYKYNQPEIHLYYYGQNPVGALIIYYGSDIENSHLFHSEFQIFLNAHNSFYNTKKSLTDFIADVMNRSIYGNGCGYEMGTTKMVNEIELNKVENAERYVDWMRSFNLELQMWGYNQLGYLLKDNLIALENDEEKIFNHIRKRNAILETCSGCDLGLYKRNW